MSSNPLSEQQRRTAIEEIESWNYFRSLRWMETIDSTNRFLSHEVRDGAVDLPALLVATSQTGGVGRGSNKWFSPHGCLMFSLAIPIDCVANTLLPLHFGYSAAEAIEPMTRNKPLIKWPNDVFINGKKIGGILIEAIPASNLSRYRSSVAVIGAGLNCQVDFSTAPEDLRKSATSLHNEVKASHESRTSPEYVLIQVLQSWLRTEARTTMVPDWLQNHWQDVSLLDRKWVRIRTATGLVEGYCLGINTHGALLIALSDNQVVEVISGSIESYQEV